VSIMNFDVGFPIATFAIHPPTIFGIMPLASRLLRWSSLFVNQPLLGPPDIVTHRGFAA